MRAANVGENYMRTNKEPSILNFHAPMYFWP
jgi:hypothetical protein